MSRSHTPRCGLGADHFALVGVAVNIHSRLGFWRAGGRVRDLQTPEVFALEALADGVQLAEVLVIFGELPFFVRLSSTQKNIFIGF